MIPQTPFSQFREEVDTHLLRLAQGVVALEQDPANTALLKEIFRAAHTIKGAAKMLGFPDIARVTHELESVLGAMRDESLRLTPDISDLLFEAIDAITVLNQAQADPGNTPAAAALPGLDIDQLIARLQAVAAASRQAGPAGGDGAQANDLAPAAGVSRQPDAPLLTAGDDSVRVRVQKLDTLMHLSGEMVITKMQHQVFIERLQALLAVERSRARRLNEIRASVEHAWGTINQTDMEDALGHLRHYAAEVDDMTVRVLREFEDYANRLNMVSDELEDTVLSVRMLPIDTLFSTFPRAIRDFKRETGKEVALQIRGGETEIDKQILEALGDPLIHLLRNALDHGIELPEHRLAAGKSASGLVSVHAYQQGTQAVIEVADDGAGIDPVRLRSVAVQKNFVDRIEAEKLQDADVLNLIFYPGFSTASIITDVSGRGVGMDVVKSTVESRLNGTATVESTLGAGTRITLRFPLTLVTMKALLVRVASQVFVLPSHTIESGMDYIGPDDIRVVENHEVVQMQGHSMPLIRLEELLDLERVKTGAWLRDAGLAALLPVPGRPPANGGAPPEPDAWDTELYAAFATPVLGTGVRLANKLPGVVVGSGDRQVCFLVDELIDELDVVVKNFGSILAGVNPAMGATVLGDGRVVIILDVPSLLIEARNRNNRGPAGHAWPSGPPAAKPRILVVDDSITTRELEKSILEAAGFAIDIAMDGLEALGKLERQIADGGPPYDLVIADIEMPHMDGLELTQQIKTHPAPALRALPVIIVSSLASAAYKQRGIEVGAQAYITKGQFDQNQLLQTIDLLIHSS